MKRDILVLVMLVSVIAGAIPAQFLSLFMSLESIVYLRMASVIIFVPSIAILSALSIINIALYLNAKRQVSKISGDIEEIANSFQQ